MWTDTVDTALLERAKTALLILKKIRVRAVLSGGKGDGENISEAEAMYRYLTGHGIDGDRLIREEESTSTKRIWWLRKIRNYRLFRRRGDEQFSCMERTAIARKCGFREVAMVPSRYRSWRLFIYIPVRFWPLSKTNSWEICRSCEKRNLKNFVNMRWQIKNTALIMNHKKKK